MRKWLYSSAINNYSCGSHPLSCACLSCLSYLCNYNGWTGPGGGYSGGSGYDQSMNSRGNGGGSYNSGRIQWFTVGPSNVASGRVVITFLCKSPSFVFIKQSLY